MATAEQKRGLLGLGGAVVLGLVLLAAGRAGPAASPEAVRRDFLAVAAALEGYRVDHGRYPRGNNFSIMQALLGRHAPGESRVYFKARSSQIDDKGRLLDPWGRPYEMTINEVNGTVRIRSAGPDGIWDLGRGGDDVRNWEAPAAVPSSGQ